jgi:hypothetical protein
MTVVEASWQDATGSWQTAPARMEDKSAGGACIRLKKSVELGTKLKIRWRFEQISGLVKYCRSEGTEFVVGVQRENTAIESSIRSEISHALSVKDAPAPPLPGVQEEKPAPQEPEPAEISAASNKTDTGPVTSTTAAKIAPLAAAGTTRERSTRDWKRVSRRSLAISQRTKTVESEAPTRKEISNEGKPMKRKWLDLAPWNHKNGGHSVNDTIKDSVSPGGSRRAQHDSSIAQKDEVMTDTTQSPVKTSAESAPKFSTFQVELLPLEDVFRAAVIVTPRKGYGVTKIIEMMNSEHIRTLSKEMKRAAILMALDAAAISVEQIQSDAKARQEALDAYEGSQKKQAEADWTRKTEEIIQIQSELESVKAHYMARINRCTEALARDKARFNAWVTTKEQESRSMTEAVELCLKAPGSEPARTALTTVVAAGAGVSLTMKGSG